jgi:hypothetical protein
MSMMSFSMTPVLLWCLLSMDLRYRTVEAISASQKKRFPSLTTQWWGPPIGGKVLK